MTKDANQLEALLTSLPVAAFVVSCEGCLLAHNEHAVELWGEISALSKVGFIGPVGLFSLDGQPISPEDSFVARAFSSGEDQNTDCVLVCRDGRRRTVSANVRPLRNDDGQIDRAVCILVDISAQHQTRAGVKRVSDFHESIIRTAGEGICACFSVEAHPYVKFSVWNDRMTEITGYSIDEINHLGWYQTVYPDPNVRQRAQERMDQMRDGMDLRSEEWTITRKNGEERTIAISTSLVELEDGQSAVVALILDVTEKHAIKHALVESEERYKLALQATQLGPWDWDMKSDKVFFSGEWMQQLGHPGGDGEGTLRDWVDRLHPDDKDHVLKRLNEYLEGRSPEYHVEFRLRHAEGNYRWIYTRGVAHRDADGKAVRMVGCHLDITQRKRTEDTLRHIVQSVASTTGEEYFSQLVEYLGEVCESQLTIVAETMTSDPQGMRTIAISSAGNQDGVSSDDVDAAALMTLCNRHSVFHEVVGDLGLLAGEWLHRRKVREILGIPLKASSGETIGLLLMLYQEPVEDVDRIKSLLRVLGARSGAELERHRAVAAVRRSEQRLASIAATVPQALYVFNIQTNENEFHNRFVARDLGYSKNEIEQLGGNILAHLLHPDDLKRLPELLARWDSAQDGEVFEVEYRMRHKSGQWRHYLGRDTVYERDEEGRVLTIIGTAQDITARKESEEERRRLESQVQHGQKLESLGILAGGIAHDFNNLLTSILSFSDLALESMRRSGKAAEYIEEAIKGAKSAAELTSQMLAYSGQGSFNLSPINLSDVVSETSRLLQVSISKSCHLRLDLCRELPACNVDSSQLKQVIMNLIINASEAIGDASGTIEVTTGWSPWLECSTMSGLPGQELVEGPYVYLEVRDDGCGMDPATQQRLFDPFFSTKFSGRGLGMSAVLGIVRGHHGAIHVESAVDEGSCFRVFLPVSAQDATAECSADDCDSVWIGSGKVLVADDEAFVLKSTSTILRHLGFDVVCAADGREAVELFSAMKDEIDWVLLDLTMPRLDGVQACTQIREIRNDARVILMSGYTQEATAEGFNSCSCSAFLKKPFQIGTLKGLLQQVCSE